MVFSRPRPVMRARMAHVHFPWAKREHACSACRRRQLNGDADGRHRDGDKPRKICKPRRARLFLRRVTG